MSAAYRPPGHLTSLKTRYLSREQPPQMSDASGEVLGYDKDGVIIEEADYEA
jgi:hypothetical protein